METWAKKGRRDKCDSVLLKMLSAGYKPDPLSCRLLLNVHASTDLADSAERTEETLQRLLQAGVRMDEHLLISQLQAWSKSKSPVAANKAEAALAKGLANGVRPSATLFNVLLDTHGKSRQPDSPEVPLLFPLLCFVSLPVVASQVSAITSRRASYSSL
jgi:pentatricopeptide repeat protein